MVGEKKIEGEKMGVTIHYALGIWEECALHEILQDAEERALALEVKEKGGLNLEIIERRLPILTQKKYYEEMFVCSAFCKTQFAGKEVHRDVAEIVRLVASRCSLVYINDEGNYYETQDESRAESSIEAGQALIDTLVTLLSSSGFNVKSGVVVGKR